MKNPFQPFLQTKIALQAVRTFDRASGIVVLIVWGAAIILMGLAYLSVQQTLHARQQIAQAQADQPSLPQFHEQPVDGQLLDTMTQKLIKRYGGKLTVTGSGGEIRMSGATADAYQSFLSAIAYLDTVTPDVSWKIKDFCVGSECKEGMMSVHLSGGKVGITDPTQQDN